MASPYYERESAQYLPTYIGSHGGFEPCGEMSKPSAHLRPKRFHMAFESWKLAQYSFKICPGQIWSQWALYLGPKVSRGPFFYTLLKVIPMRSKTRSPRIQFKRFGRLGEELTCEPTFDHILGIKGSKHVTEGPYISLKLHLIFMWTKFDNFIVIIS